MKNLAAYKIFFTLGLLNAVLGVGVWLFQDLHLFSTPALLIHSKLIAGGFLWSFVVGYLLTSLPQVTGAKKASLFEIAITFVIIVSMMLAAWRIDPRPFYAGVMALITFLLVFSSRRILSATKPRPFFLSHLGLAMALALIGAWYHFRGQSFMGIHLYQVGSILILVLGIGESFFSYISEVSSVFENETNIRPRWIFHFGGLMTTMLLFLAGLGESTAYLGLSLMSVFYLFMIWKVQRSTARSISLKYGARIAAASIPISFLLIYLQPALYVMYFHVLFIGCFAVIAFFVTARVASQEGFSSVNETLSSKVLWWVLGFLILSLISRLPYSFSTGLWRKSYLHFAGTFWFLAIGACGWSFLLQVFKNDRKT